MTSDAASIAEQYRRFAAVEARGHSPLYERLALGVAGDPDLLGYLSGLPPDKRQPNLLLAAARLVAGTPAGFADLRRAVLEHREAVTAVILSRRVQTNEAARCTALYPLLAALPQPLALLEVGASAGLCLIPERYRYDYDGVPAGDPTSPVTLVCEQRGGYRCRPGPVRVAWRCGIDLNPLDVTDAEDVRWLETLVWPEQHERAERLHAAIALARTDPPPIVRGDLVALLRQVAGDAPEHATLVIFHTATLAYLEPAGRDAFGAEVAGTGARWISQEGPGVLPRVAAAMPVPAPTGTATYCLALDGRPVALTAPHGGWLRWLVDPVSLHASGR